MAQHRAQRSGLERFVRATGQICWHQREFLTHTQCVSAASGSGSAANPPGPPAQPSGPAAPPESSSAAQQTPGGWNAPSCSPPGAAGRPEQLPRRTPRKPLSHFPKSETRGSQGPRATLIPPAQPHTRKQGCLFSLGSSELAHLPPGFPKAPVLGCCPSPEPRCPYISFQPHLFLLILQQLPPPLQGLLL